MLRNKNCTQRVKDIYAVGLGWLQNIANDDFLHAKNDLKDIIQEKKIKNGCFKSEVFRDR